MTTLEETHSRDAVVTLTFELSDSSLPVLASAEMDGCRFTLVEIVPGADGRHTAYYRVEGCDSNRVVDLTTEHDDCNAHVFDFGDSIALLKLTLTDDHPLVVLTAQGALPRRVVIADGETTLTVEVPPGFDVTDLISRFNAAFPDANLAARRQDASVTPLFSELAVERVLATRLTDRQRDVIQAAHDEGFYQWPREISGEQLSEKFDISPPTFHPHLRAAEKKLGQFVLDERGDLDSGFRLVSGDGHTE